VRRADKPLRHYDALEAAKNFVKIIKEMSKPACGLMKYAKSDQNSNK